MGKKKKKKLKKKLIRQRLAALEQQGFKEETKKPGPKAAKTIETKIKRDLEETKDQDYIKKDLKKVSFIGIVLILIFIVLIILKIKTSYITDAGDWVFSVLNIG